MILVPRKRGAGKSGIEKILLQSSPSRTPSAVDCDLMRVWASLALEWDGSGCKKELAAASLADRNWVGRTLENLLMFHIPRKEYYAKGQESPTGTKQNEGQRFWSPKDQD